MGSPNVLKCPWRSGREKSRGISVRATGKKRLSAARASHHSLLSFAIIRLPDPNTSAKELKQGIPGNASMPLRVAGTEPILNHTPHQSVVCQELIFLERQCVSPSQEHYTRHRAVILCVLNGCTHSSGARRGPYGKPKWTPCLNGRADRNARLGIDIPGRRKEKNSMDARMFGLHIGTNGGLAQEHGER
jgi:hypothetical protein